MSLLVLPNGLPLTALRNNGNAGQIVAGSAAVIDSFTACTVMWWMRNTSLANGRNLFSKITGSVGWDIDTTDTSGNFRWFNRRATTNMIYTTTSTPLVPSGGWKLIAATKDEALGAGLVVRIYRGDVNTPPTEVTYAAFTEGTGAFSNDAAANLTPGGGSSFNIVGDLGPCVYVKGVLPLADIRAWWLNPTVMPVGCVGFWVPGAEGTGLVLDRSGNGNHGTITSMIPVPGLPQGYRSRVRTYGMAGRGAAVSGPQFRVMGMVG